MTDDQKSSESILDSDDNVDEHSMGVDILTLMRNMIESEESRKDQIEIFDENTHSIHPTYWTQNSQLATCKKCGRTGDSITQKKCGVGNLCCTCCFCLTCLWPCIPFMCFFVCDHHHYCYSCQEIMGKKTFI